MWSFEADGRWLLAHATPGGVLGVFPMSDTPANLGDVVFLANAIAYDHAGITERLGLYAMAARQVDPLSEYICLWRVLESADGRNGKQFATTALDQLATFDFGECLLRDAMPQTRSRIERVRAKWGATVYGIRRVGRYFAARGVSVSVPV